MSRAGNERAYLLRVRNAIIVQAAEDYRTAVAQDDTDQLYALEEFFLSDWCYLLCGESGIHILQRLQSETKEEAIQMRREAELRKDMNNGKWF